MMTNRITLQDIFDKAWQKFVVECGKPATYNGATCAYQVTVDDEIRNCAVGLALSEEQLKVIIGNPDFAGLYEQYSEWFDIDSKYTTYHALNQFQKTLHDDLIQYLGKEDCKGIVKRSYLHVAKLYNLTIPENTND